jgi:hypothetical protein
MSGPVMPVVVVAAGAAGVAVCSYRMSIFLPEHGKRADAFDWFSVGINGVSALGALVS